jgi:hypothetical protein
MKYHLEYFLGTREDVEEEDPYQFNENTTIISNVISTNQSYNLSEYDDCKYTTSYESN